MLKTILGITLGLILGIFVITLVEGLGHILFGVADPNLDLEDPEAVKAAMANLPLAALLFVPLSFAVGSFVAGLISTLISERSYTFWPAIIAGGALMLLGVVNLTQLPHPTWLAVIIVIVFLPSAFLGYKVLRRSKS